MVNNPELFKPSVALKFETIEYQGKMVIRVWIPQDSAVHSYRKVIYDRVGDADVRLKLDSRIGELYLRKQSIYTEQKVYPYVTFDDLELSLLVDARSRAGKRRSDYPRLSMSDTELLRGASLYVKNYETGEEGFNLAAVLLLGRDEVIQSIVPSYKTDAILRVKNTGRYDDRLTVKSNLLKAHSMLESFCKKNLEDRFYIENGQAISPRDVIIRESVSNTLIHREYLSVSISISCKAADFLISKDEFMTENGNKTAFDGQLDLTAFNPMPKNPIIASFFNQIGWADELGSGAKNLLKYVRVYSGATPSLVEGPVFRAFVPLSVPKAKPNMDKTVVSFVAGKVNDKGYVTTVDVRDGLGMGHKQAQRELAKLVESGVIRPAGRTRGRRYVPVE